MSSLDKKRKKIHISLCVCGCNKVKSYENDIRVIKSIINAYRYIESLFAKKLRL